MRLLAAGMIVMLGAVLGLCGCVSKTCASWIEYETPEEALEHADFAVIGTVEARDGSASFFGVDSHAWTVRVDEVLVGTVDGDEVRAVSTPPTCTGGETYPDGDPFEAAAEDGERVAVLLRRDGGMLRTITPTDGIHPAEAFGR